jgi:hypothetical protein
MVSRYRQSRSAARASVAVIKVRGISCGSHVPLPGPSRSSVVGTGRGQTPASVDDCEEKSLSGEVERNARTLDHQER